MRIIYIALALVACNHPRTEVFQNHMTAVSSPCQCRAAGDDTGCYLSSNARKYFDGTSHTDYDAWGYYHGDLDVPAVCRLPGASP